MPSLTRPSLPDLYGRVAETWQGGIERLGYPAAYAALFAAAPPPAPGRMLDLGTGSGAFAAACLRAAPSRPDALTLLDTSAEMLDRAREHLATMGLAPECIHSGIGADALAARTFDTILAAHVIEHLDDPHAALAWCRDRLAPAGQLYLAVSRPHWCTALLRWKWGHRAYRPEVMLEMLSQAGFRGLRHVPFPSGPPSRTSAGYVARA